MKRYTSIQKKEKKNRKKKKEKEYTSIQKKKAYKMRAPLQEGTPAMQNNWSNLTNKKNSDYKIPGLICSPQFMLTFMYSP